MGHRAAWLEGLGYDVPEQMFTEGYEAEDIYKRGGLDRLHTTALASPRWLRFQTDAFVCRRYMGESLLLLARP